MKRLVHSRRQFLTLGGSAAVSLAAVHTTSAFAQGGPLILKGITPWTADYDLSKAFFIFQELVTKKLGGKVIVSFLGGPEVAAPNQQFAALKNGVVDVLLGAAAYYRGEVPAAAAVQFTKKKPSELRQSGYYQIMRDLHQKQGGVIYLANTAGGNKFRIYVKKPLDKPSFSGLKIRVSPVYTPLVTALGGTPVQMAPGDVYTGLERGVVDGFGWTYTGIDIFGWHEVSKYVIDHPFYSLDGALLFNANVWNKLSPDVQAVFEEIGVELEKKVEEYIASQLAKEDERLKKLGLQFIRFSDADAEKFVTTAYDAGWKDFIAKNDALFTGTPGLREKLVQLGG